MSADARVANHHRRTAGILDAAVLLPSGGDRRHGRTVLRAGCRHIMRRTHRTYFLLCTGRDPIVLRRCCVPFRVRAGHIVR
jgi:hypothetical protein